MGLTGLDIYKNLPKENCKECGLPTCLAFAMKVAAGQLALDACPRLDDSAKGSLDEASAPPQQLVKIGAGDQAFELGRETVLYRHEEKFHHPTAIAISLNDEMDKETIEKRCATAKALQFERVGMLLEVDMVAVYNSSEDAAKFTEAAKIASAASGMPVALCSPKADSLRAAGEALKAERPLLWAMNADADSIAVAKDLDLPICLEAKGFNAIVSAGEQAREAGLKEVILSPGQAPATEVIEFLTQSRRAAIEKKFRPLGFPIAVPCLSTTLQSVVEACWYVTKFAGIVVLDSTEPEHVLAVLTTRQDIYTDPQKPVQVEAGVHEVGDPGDDAPLLLTTNFALSYYSVEGEVGSARIGARILAVDTEGTSVLTAWAADKFNEETITAALKASGLEGKLTHKKVILPGYVAVLSAGIQEESGWEVIVGPKEASGLVTFLKGQWKP